MKMKKIIITTFVFLLISTYSFAQDGILGTWYNTEKTGKVKIYKVGDKFFGKLVWLEEPNDPDDGLPKRDKENPDDKLAKKTLLGTVLLKDFKFDEDNVWEGGTIYDPENGKTYSCKMTLKDNNHLDVRGFIGFSLLGRTENWTRAK